MKTRREKINFQGHDGSLLAGLAEYPEGEIISYALFAHCFTCGKDIAAASRIARALASRGIAVLRFDFTGLGNSDGDFANTNFSSNVQDLVAAANYMRETMSAPSIVIGHSLGGTAVLKAASVIAEAKGIVTIGAPATAQHVAKQFKCDIDRISEQGEAQVDLAGRTFTIKKQFIDDIKDQGVEHVVALKKALLVFHSPIDTVVSVAEAEKIYHAAKHPKSFISLDTADHLLSKSSDANYVAGMIASWAVKYIQASEQTAEPAAPVAKGAVRVEEHNHVFTQTVRSDSHEWLADEPTAMGGNNSGPDPYEHLLAALGACTSMTLRMYASRKKWPLEHVSVELQHGRSHGEDCEHCDDDHQQVDVIKRQIRLDGDLDAKQRARLLEIADRCPVHKTLHNKIVVETSAA
ncbi:MAG: alpha/beta fold hydrolase [Pseudomonadales bacterium]